MSSTKTTEFSAYRDCYREAVEESIAFCGVELDFFTRAKARELIELVSARVAEAQGLAFLDVGCGPGETDSFLEGRVASLTGIDVASEMIDRAGERNPWAEYRECRAGEPIPAADEAFDVSFAICVLHHVVPEARLSLLAEMHRVTKPGGLVMLFEHNPWNPLTRRAVSNCEFDKNAELLSRRRAARLLREAGLVDVHGGFIIYFTRESPRRRAIERRLRRVPLGAQYVVAGVRT